MIANLPIQDDSKENEERMQTHDATRRPVALVLLAEAHVAVTVALGHAGVVHHEEVDLEVVGAGSPDLVMFCK